MNYRISHTTKYIYQGKVNLCYNEARLTPRNLAGQICKSSIISVSPVPALISERTDFFGNSVRYFSIERPHEELIVTAVSYVERITENYQFSINHPSSWEAARDQIRRYSEFTEVRQFIIDSPLIMPVAEIEIYAQQSFTPGCSVFEAVCDLMNRIHHDFEFLPGCTDVTTSLSELMKDRKGVCQDFAHVGIACLRAMGLPARYMSGYIETSPPPGKERMVGADASHAWFSVYIPEIGWLDFDPTNNQLAGATYITVAWGRDFSDVTPLKGIIFSSGMHELLISVDVQNLDVL